MFQKYSKKALLLLGVIALIGAILLPTLYAAAFNPDPNTLDIDGSTTVYPVVQVSMTRFPISFPGTIMNVTSTGSGHGQSYILSGQVDIGMSSSNCNDANAGLNGANAAIYSCTGTGGRPALVDTQFARDAVTMIANRNFINSTCGWSSPNLTLAQIQGIYEGTITNWNTLYSGCPSQTIVPRARIVGSGTRASFLALANVCSTSDGKTCISGGVVEETVITNTGLPREAGNPQMEFDIDNNPGQIGYIGLAFEDANNIQFSVNGVFPNATTVLNGTYPMGRVLHLFTAPTSGSPSNNKQRVQDYLSWIMSPEGQADVQNVGYVPMAPVAPDWDVNLDHNCNVLDLVSIGGFWNQTAPASGDPNDPLIRGWIRQDVNWDGHVNVLDLVSVGTHWGSHW